MVHSSQITVRIVSFSPSHSWMLAQRAFPFVHEPNSWAWLPGLHEHVQDSFGPLLR
jgi:hypothetical protein